MHLHPPRPASLREFLDAIRWIALAAIVGAVVGSACALFLWALEWATTTRFAHPWLLYALPLAGIATALVYRAVGGTADRGTDLIVDEIHGPGVGAAGTSAGVPTRMAPLVLVATVVTHLFGGSAGREGTAVQMGASLAAAVGRALHLDADATRTLLTAGVAAGFGAVFGTPLAGAVFAIEVLTRGRVRYDALLPGLVASVVGDLVCAHGWGTQHTPYPLATFGAAHAAGAIATHGPVAALALKSAVAGVAFGLASVAFVALTHGLKHALARLLPDDRAWLRPAAAGLAVIALVWLLATRDYLGLGVRGEFANSVTIPGAFLPDGATALSWLWKLIFTSVTLAGGFKGGEVTPLFFIGATLGNALAGPLGAPVDLMAALGFVAVFAGATKTPLACTIMGVELFAAHGDAIGSGLVVYLAIACTCAFLASGRRGIYATQRHAD